MYHPHAMEQERGRLGLGDGVGLVVSSMVGAGVFVSAGFMVQDMGPGTVLAAWVVGAVIALSGARAYATVAEWVPRSGGEYKFLSELLHPALGYLAGWASLLLGFSAPLAVDALVSGSFAATIVPGTDPATFGVIVIVALTVLHAVDFRSSKWTHTILVVVDGVLLAGFVVVGLAYGHNAWPGWTPPNVHAGFPTDAFMQSLFFIAFAFSGWNAAAYAADEFKDARRDVPRSMLLGCALVAILYLVVNWVFVANLTPEQGRTVFQYEQTRITLGHVVVRQLVGPWGARAMSVLALVAFIAAASAMTLVGPRVYAAMAKDGFLPKALAGRAGKPPAWSLILQAAMALLILSTHSLQQVLANVGAILTLFAALTSFTVFRVRFFPSTLQLQPPSTVTMIAAFVHVASAALMLYFGFRGSTHLLLWVAAVSVVALGAYGATEMMRPAAPREE